LSAALEVGCFQSSRQKTTKKLGLCYILQNKFVGLVPSQPTNKEDFCLKNWANVKLG
jgi:hypothetical protein